MSRHYSDYQKMSVPVKDLVFEKIQDSDKELVKKVSAWPNFKGLVYQHCISCAFIHCFYCMRMVLRSLPDNSF